MLNYFVQMGNCLTSSSVGYGIAVVRRMGYGHTVDGIQIRFYTPDSQPDQFKSPNFRNSGFINSYYNQIIERSPLAKYSIDIIMGYINSGLGSAIRMEGNFLNGTDPEVIILLRNLQGLNGSRDRVVERLESLVITAFANGIPENYVREFNRAA